MDKEFNKDIGVELENLERLVWEMKELINKVKDNPDFITTRAAGSILHDFYSGIEKMFERIASDGVLMLVIVFWITIASMVICGALWARFNRKG